VKKRGSHRPPRLARWFLRRMARYDIVYASSGDFEEEYRKIRDQEGMLKALFWYWFQVVGSLPCYAMQVLYWRGAMIRNYIKIALRNIRRHKVYSFINIFGLAIGMACCLLIFLWVQDEFKYDRFHEKKDRLHQVYSRLQYTDGRQRTWTGSYYPLADVLKEECPEVEEAVRIELESSILLKHGEKASSDNRAVLTEPSFFDMFSFPFVRGNPKTAFSDKLSIVITQETARRYFGAEDPMGKVITVNNQIDLVVTGVLEDIPAQSSLQFDCVAPFTLMFPPEFKLPTHWGGNPLATFVVLHDNANLSEVGEKMTGIVQKHHPRDTSKEDFFLHPLSKFHLYSPDGGGLIQTLMIFSIIAIFVLMIACINFMNLSTAKATTRAGEVGMRKVVGARKTDLIKQFFGESLLLSFITLFFAILIVAILLPTFNGLIDKQLSLRLLLDPVVMAGFIAIALLTGIVSGSYPALFLSSFQPVLVLRGVFRSGVKGASFRRALVIIQFTLSILLMIGTIGLYRQLDFMRHKELGFEKENLLNVSIYDGIKNNYESVKNELLRNPAVLSVTKSAQHPANIGSSVSAVDWDGKNPQESVSFHWDVVDYDYTETFGMDMLEGRSFSKDIATDVDGAYIVNEEAIRLMGMNAPVGQRLSVFRNEGHIIGVVKNFHFQPLYHEIRPFVLSMSTTWANHMFIRIRPQNVSETLAFIQDVCERFDPDYPTNIRFFSDTMMRLNYSTEQRIGRITGYFTVLAILISCLGLMGLASFMAEQKTKEIGIRKVMGASVTGVLLMLSKEFTKWVVVANIVAWPAAYFMMQKMLSMYAFRTRIGLHIYILSGLTALLIAWLTVSYQAIRAAQSNPVNALRYE